MVNGNRHGGLARSIADKIKSQRREVLPPDHPLRKQSTPSNIPLPTNISPFQQRERELQGGIIVVGRHTLKEYMHGLRIGWSESLDNIDKEEALARHLASDGVFDEPGTPSNSELLEDSDGARPLVNTNFVTHGSKSPLFSHVITSPTKTSPSQPLDSQARQSIDNTVPREIPLQPPLLLLPFKNMIGFRYIPFMIADFFNERKRAREGAEAAHALIEGQTRDFIPPDRDTELLHLVDSSPSMELEGLEVLTDSVPKMGPQGGDLDFEIEQERYIPKGYDKIPKEIAKARKKYYEALPGKLAVARSLARNEREPTKDEREHPPPTEVELTTERFKKELKWREQLDGWKLLRAGSGVDWDSRLATSLRVYGPPSIFDT